jgi:hypothetical protein
MLPPLVVYFGAAMLLCTWLRSARPMPWALALGAIGVAVHFATSWVASIDGVVAAIDYVMWQVPPLLGAWLGGLAWQSIARRRVSNIPPVAC